MPSPQPEFIAPGIARFNPQPEPSLALERHWPSLGPLPASFRTIPAFSHEDGRHVARVALPPGTSLYGTGEVPGPLLRNSRRIVTWNSDRWCYGDTDVSLYQSHPWVLAVLPGGRAVGILADTARRLTIALDETIEIAANPGDPSFTVCIVERDHPAAVVTALADLTGRMPLPPLWALGYQQCRWSYETEERVKVVADQFRARHIPCDVIWMDIDYMDGYRCFTFSPQHFPDPRGLSDYLHRRNFRGVWMIDPGLKEDPEYRVYAAGRDGGHFVLDEAGREYHGRVWPGSCAFPDFTRAETRRWWAGLYTEFLEAGIDGVWNDMNEPSVEDNHQKQVPETLHHRADPELGGPGPHSKYHNVYGMLMARATRDGIAAARPRRRPFVLTRANFLGGQRYAATWTGDNRSTWEHLAWSIPMVLNLGLSGQPFSGPDIGGFAGDATPALFARWMGIGSLLPFARGHSIKDSAPHEPWSFGPDCERACRLALERRYRLLPYLYTLFHEASTTGMPIARPLFFADPADPVLRSADDSFLLGQNLLVRARVAEEGSCRAPYPPGLWKPVEIVGDSTTTTAHPDLPDLCIRAGAIIPLGPIRRHVGESPDGPLTLMVCPDARGNAAGTLYEDPGDGPPDAPAHRLTTFTASPGPDGRPAISAIHTGDYTPPRGHVGVVIV
ncbi:MAG: alpha-glucosidase [Phycisphaerales bacterium]|nr:alpha-glucosidase [Phycisphaerales bacterium]